MELTSPALASPTLQGPAAPVVVSEPTELSRNLLRRRQATRLSWLGFLLVALIQVWVLSAGWITYLPQYSAYYNRLSEAFRRGQCSLLIRPDSRHLALPDPYDPVDNLEFRSARCS